MIDLVALGWEVYYTCACKAGKRKFFRNEQYKGYEIRINERKNTFSILQNNSIIAGPDWSYKLETKMIENGILVK